MANSEGLCLNPIENVDAFRQLDYDTEQKYLDQLYHEDMGRDLGQQLTIPPAKQKRVFLV